MLDTRTGFRRPPNFSISKHLGDSFGVFKGKARHRVRIRFDAFASRLVAERHWHPSQKIQRLPDGEIELSMTLGSLEEAGGSMEDVKITGRDFPITMPIRFRVTPHRLFTQAP